MLHQGGGCGEEAGRRGAGLLARGQRCPLPSAAVWGCSTPHPWSCLVGEFTRLLRPLAAPAAHRWGAPGCASCPAHGLAPHLNPSAVSPALIPFSLSKWLSVLLFLLFSVLVGIELFALLLVISGEYSHSFSEFLISSKLSSILVGGC